jgi:hypothetical protein
MKFSAKTIRARDFSKYNPTDVTNELRNANWSDIFSANDTTNAVLCFNTILNDTFTKHAPFINKRVKGRPCPWLDKDTKSHMNNRDKALRKARRSKNENDWNFYKTLRNHCNNLLRYAKSKYNKTLLNNNYDNPRRFWSAIKKIFPTKHTANPTASRYNNESRVKRFSEHFAKAVTSLKTKFIHCCNFMWQNPRHILPRTLKSFHFKPASKQSILKQLKKLKRNKSTGLDELPPNMLKDCAEAIYSPLTHIINMSLRHCEVPAVWKKAKITPIFKAGDANDPDNYRPISILPTLSKILERTVHSQLMEHLETENLLSEFQFGFRAKRSTELATTLFVDNIRREVNNGKLVGSVFMDLSRAFDTISHSQLLAKLSSYGIRDNELHWFTSYLFHRTQLVEIDGSRSTEQPVFNGVPQGSILGPLLFVVFFNDIVDSIQHAHITMYADDAVIYYAHKDVREIEKCLDDEFERTAEYLNTNELILNLNKGKTESLLFGTGKRLNNVKKPFEVKFQSNVINNVGEYKYLGNVVDSTLTLRNDFDKKYRKASNRVQLLQKLRPYLTKSASMVIYNSMIVPLLTYCGIINLNTNRTQQTKFLSIERRSARVIGRKKVPSIKNRIEKRANIIVWNALNGMLCSNFNTYFAINTHGKLTRNGNFLIKLPRIKLEFSRNSFYYYGAHLYNSLPLEIRKEVSISIFKNKLREFYDQ